MSSFLGTFKKNDEFTTNNTWVVRGKKEDIEALGDSVAIEEVYPGIYEGRFWWDESTFDEISKFLKRHKSLKIAGFLPKWAHGIKVYSFYSENGSEDASVDFVAYSDGHLDADGRWYYCADVTSDFCTKEYWSSAGEYDDIRYSFIWRDEWNDFRKFLLNNNGTELDFPQGLTTLEKGSFQDVLTLKNIHIPSRIVDIGTNSFIGCFNVESITVEEGNPVYRSEGNCLIETETQTVILGCRNSLIPDSVTNIAHCAFRGCTNLQSITIGNGVTNICWRAFYGCPNLQSITIGNGVTSIGDSAFDGCTRIQGITIPDSVKSIGSYAFRGCTGLQSITIPDSVMSIGEDSFYGCDQIRKCVLIPGSTDEEWCKEIVNVIGFRRLAYAFLSGNMTTNPIIEKILKSKVTAKAFRTKYIPVLIEERETEAMVKMLALVKKMQPEEIDSYINLSVEKGTVEITNRLIEYQNK